jgi:trimethylamine--corrinoid protein Co-methyltransferase
MLFWREACGRRGDKIVAPGAKHAGSADNELGNEMSDTPPRESGRRRRRGDERASAAAVSLPPAQPQSPFAPIDLISRDELESIHRSALMVLNEIGIDFLHDGARAMLKEAGADVDQASRRVRFDPALVEAHIGLAPLEFTLHARNPARNLTIGGRHIAFGSVGSTPNSFDRAGGRRPGNKRDYQDFIRLGQTFDSIHFWGGYPVEPIDIHASVRSVIHAGDQLSACADCYFFQPSGD